MSVRNYVRYKNFVQGVGKFQLPTPIGRRLRIYYSFAEYIPINPRFHSVSKFVSHFDRQRVRQYCYVEYNPVMRVQNIL